MAYRTVSIDAAVQICLGVSALGGAAPSYGVAADLGGNRRKVTIGDSLETVDTAGGTNTRKSFRAHRGSTEITIDMAVLSTGADYYNKLGYYAKVQIKELSSLGAFKDYEGVITAWSWDADAEEQLQHCTILCDTEHA